jgi:hypothetical protein
MELVRVVRLLWRRRIALAAGLVGTATLAVVGGRPAPTSSGVAYTRVAIDTPRSVLVDTTPAGATTLAWRAALLSHLAAADAQRRAVAGRLGVPVDQLAVVDPELAIPGVPSSLPKAVSDAIVPRAPYALSVSMPNGAVPIISIEAYAPDRNGAVRLARAAASFLESERSSSGGAGVQRFVIDRAAPIHARTLVKAHGPLRVVAVFVFLFGAWMVGVAIGPLLLRRALPSRSRAARRKPGGRGGVGRAMRTRPDRPLQ